MKNVISLSLDPRMEQQQNEFISDALSQEKERLFNFINRRVPDVESAEDILQDVFYEFVLAARIGESIERVSSWLFRVARNKIIDRFRKKKAEPFSNLERTQGEDGETWSLIDLIPFQGDSPEDSQLRKLIMETLMDALEDLPAAQREVFILQEIEGKSFKEISAKTGESINTLISRKRYAILYLRKQLQHLYKELLTH